MFAINFLDFTFHPIFYEHTKALDYEINVNIDS